MLPASWKTSENQYCNLVQSQRPDNSDVHAQKQMSVQAVGDRECIFASYFLVWTPVN